MLKKLFVTAALMAAGLGLAPMANAHIGVNPVPGPGGVTVIIKSESSYNGIYPSGECRYTAFVDKPGVGGIRPLPVVDLPFYLPEKGQTPLWFPGIPTGATWDITVNCPPFKLGTFAIY